MTRTPRNSKPRKIKPSPCGGCFIFRGLEVRTDLAGVQNNF